MKVELVGVSGSGKTTLAKCVEKRLQEQHGLVAESTTPAFRPSRSAWYKVCWLFYSCKYFRLDTWRLYYRHTNIAYWYKRRGLSHKMWLAWQPVFVSYYLQQIEKNKIDVVVDDGSPFHRYVPHENEDSTYINEDFVGLYERSTLNMCNQVLVVEIDTPSEVAAGRRMARDKIAGSQKESLKKQIVAQRQKHKATLNKVDASFSDETVTVMTVDGTKTPEVLAKEVAEKVMEIGEFGGRGEGVRMGARSAPSCFVWCSHVLGC